MKTQENTHSKFSPSVIASLATCPGYCSKPNEIDEEEDMFSPSVVGTRIHEALEKDDSSILLTGFEEKLFDSGKRAVEVVLESLEEMWGVNRDKFTIHKEYKFKGFLVEGVEETQRGTADLMITTPADVFGGEVFTAVIDYKMGMVQVDPPYENPQLMGYGAMAFEEFDIARLDLFVIQPQSTDWITHGVMYKDKQHSLPSMPQEPSSMSVAKTGVCMYADEALESYKAVVISTLNNSNNQSSYRTSPTVCNYCHRKDHCMAIINIAKRFSKDVVGEDTFEGISKMDLSQGVDNPEVLSKLLDISYVIDKAIDGWKKRAKEMIEDETYIPGYKISGGGSRLSVKKKEFLTILKEELPQEELVELIKTVDTNKAIMSLTKHRMEEDENTNEEEEEKDLLKDLYDDGVISETKVTPSLLRVKKPK